MELKKIRTTPLDGKPQGSQYNSLRPPTTYAPPSRSETTPTPAAGLVPGQPYRIVTAATRNPEPTRGGQNPAGSRLWVSSLIVKNMQRGGCNRKGSPE